MSEVVAAFDAIAQGLSEYHAVMGYFPDQSYTAQNLASFSERFATITIINGSDPNVNVKIRAAFNINLDLTDDPSTYGNLDMLVEYSLDKGYQKTWDLSTPGIIDAIYLPRTGATGTH